MNPPVTDHVTTATTGCSLGMCSKWVCTEHVTWEGIDLCVASNTHAIVGVGLRGNLEVCIDIQKVRPGAQWPDLVKVMENDGRFCPAPTDEEVEAAAQGALRLFKEMNQ